MARKARAEFAGAVYHLLDRGDRQEAIFSDDPDRERFLSTLGQVCAGPRRVSRYSSQKESESNKELTIHLENADARG